MKRPSTVSQNVRIFVTAAAIAVGAMGCGGGSDATGAGGSGGAGSGGRCDAQPIFAMKKHGACTVVGVCHDSLGTAANFNMATAGWETRLVGRAPPGGSAVKGTYDSMCSPISTPAVLGQVYLKAGSNPAAGLFLDKLMGNPPACGAHMPNLGEALSTAELACVQDWANGLVAAAK
jgi:hypothetical protein